jgi:hypothetical protein
VRPENAPLEQGRVSQPRTASMTNFLASESAIFVGISCDLMSLPGNGRCSNLMMRTISRWVTFAANDSHVRKTDYSHQGDFERVRHGCTVPATRTTHTAHLVPLLEEKIIVRVEMQLGEDTLANKLVGHLALHLQRQDTHQTIAQNIHSTARTRRRKHRTSWFNLSIWLFEFP